MMICVCPPTFPFALRTWLGAMDLAASAASASLRSSGGGGSATSAVASNVGGAAWPNGPTDHRVGGAGGAGGVGGWVEPDAQPQPTAHAAEGASERVPAREVGDPCA